MIADRYELIKLLGQGGMGYVWWAHDLVLDRDVAVKEVFVPDPGGERNRRAFREARAAARLNHPGIVTIHDLVVADGRSWIVMELVNARSLDDTIQKHGPLPPRQVAQIGMEMLEALRAAHHAGILHRDIKPANVLLTQGGAVITDFGIAIIQGEERLTRTGQVIGTPAYMAPEQVRGEPASQASDMWSLGATLYAALTGHPPNGQVTIPDADPLTAVIGGLLRPDPRDRLTAEQADAMLSHAMSPQVKQPEIPGQFGQTTSIFEPGRQTRILRSPTGLRSWRAAAVALVGVAAAVALIVVLTGGFLGRSRAGPPAQSSPSARAAKARPETKIPPGYRVYTDSARHFSAAIPDSWLPSTEDGVRRFCAPGGCPAGIVADPVHGSSPEADIDKYPLVNGHLPAADYSGYHRLWIRPVSYYAQAAEAEFKLRERKISADIEGIVRVFTVTNGGQEYYVQVTTLSASWRADLPVFDVFFATFRPTGKS